MGPNSKAIGAGVGAAATVIIVYLIRTLTHWELPIEVQAAIEVVIGVIVTAATTWLFPANTPPLEQNVKTHRRTFGK